MAERIDSGETDARAAFLALVADVRPELHRYCSRMTGSVADAEDIVQETLARAYYALPEMEPMPPIRPWLFQIAHHRAIDHLRRYDRKFARALDETHDLADARANADDALATNEATRIAIDRFCELVPMQRSVVILKDVLGHSVDEIATLLETSDAAVKSALHRGRERLAMLAKEAPSPPLRRPISAVVERYAALFNGRDWDAVRALLADDVRLDLVSRVQRSGRRDVATYFTNYDRYSDWYLVPGWVDGREAILVYRSSNEPRPSYFVELTIQAGAIAGIRDFRYVPYIATDAAFESDLPRPKGERT